MTTLLSTKAIFFGYIYSHNVIEKIGNLTIDVMGQLKKFEDSYIKASVKKRLN